MALLLIVVGVALVLALAAVVVLWESRRLAAEPGQAVFDLDDAVDWVADHVPYEVAAELSHDDVRRIVRWHLDYFRTRGVSGNGRSAEEHTGPVVVGGADTVDFVLSRAAAAGYEYTVAQVHAVLDAQMTYLQAIGAIGPPVGDDERPA